MAERKYSYNQALKKAGKMITLILDGGLGDELIYCYSPDPVKVAWLRSIAIMENGDI